MADIIDIGARRELFVDDYLIESMRGACLDLKHPERREVFAFDAPWEDNSAFAFSVFQDGDVAKMYYRAAIPDSKDEDQLYIGLAISTDGGYSFTRPDLGLIAFQGSLHNNLLQACGFPQVPPAFIDTNPACLPDQRYKGVCGKWTELYAMTSADGLHWRSLLDGPVEMAGTFDTINTAFWDTAAGCYRCYTRAFTPVAEELRLTMPMGVRMIQMSTSPDFIHWTPTVPLQYRDTEYLMQMYTNAILPCPGAEHLYLGFPCRYVEDRMVPESLATGMNDALFMASRNGLSWTRYPDAWVRPGIDPMNWTHRNNYPIWGIIPASPTEWSMYISEHYHNLSQPTRLRRLSIRPHGFVALHADYYGGEVLTKPFIFGGSELRLNFSTSAAGSVQVDILHPDGTPIPGFTSNILFGDQLDAAVSWQGGSDLSSLAGTAVRLRFLLKDADVFAMRFI